VGCLLGSRTGMAFPASDAANPSAVMEAPQPTESDLQHQLQLHTGLGGTPLQPGWTFVPRITLQEYWTDNVLNSQNDRRWDMVTLITPSITVNGDTPNAQVRVLYGPQGRIDARTPSENSFTQQLIGTGQFTIVPDAFYVDARALSGNTAIAGGLGGLGFGATPDLSPTLSPGLGGIGTTGLSKQNQGQSSNFSLAPYWIHRFGDTGTAKIGYQLRDSTFTQGNAVFPFLATGNSASRNLSNEAVAQFETGEDFVPYRDLVILDGRIASGSGASTNSHAYTAVNRFGYLVNRNVEVYAELGYEDIYFAGTPPVQINDAIWAIGTLLIPNADSQIDVNYGHRFGQNAAYINGWYALSSRTRVALTYSTGVDSDLGTFQNQLDLLGLQTTGQAVDVQSGAPLFIGTGGLGFQAGVFRTQRVTASVSSVLDRDQFSAIVTAARSTTLSQVPVTQAIPLQIPAPPVNSVTEAFTGIVTWLHQATEELSFTANASFSKSHISKVGTLQSLSPNLATDQQSAAVSLGIQYLLTDTLSVHGRYIFVDRISSGQGQSYYQDLVLVGITKQF
jgi:hypothetical protein